MISGGAVALYGIPKSHFVNVYNLSPICVQIDSGQCDPVDIQHAYLSSDHNHESVLLWKHDALDPTRVTRLSIRLLKADGVLRIFPFKSIHYFEPQEYAR